MDADLVLEGGGVKGIGLVGAYSALPTRTTRSTASQARRPVPSSGR